MSVLSYYFHTVFSKSEDTVEYENGQQFG